MGNWSLLTFQLLFFPSWINTEKTLHGCIVRLPFMESTDLCQVGTGQHWIVVKCKFEIWKTKRNHTSGKLESVFLLLRIFFYCFNSTVGREPGQKSPPPGPQLRCKAKRHCGSQASEAGEPTRRSIGISLKSSHENENFMVLLRIRFSMVRRWHFGYHRMGKNIVLHCKQTTLGLSRQHLASAKVTQGIAASKKGNATTSE